MSTPHHVSLFDSRPFFEKALAFGLQHGIIASTKLEAINAEAPKGIVQIARYFGMPEHGGLAEQHIPLLAKWSLRPLADYQAELAQRSQVADVVNAAIWMADALGVDTTTLEEAGKDAEAVIRTALLAHACKRTELPDWATFEKMVAALRKKYGGKDAAPVPAGALPPPKNLPAEYRAAVEIVRQSVLGDLPRILDTSVTARKLFDQTPAFLGRYFWLEDALAEVEHFDRSVSTAWAKATSGHSDDGSLLTLFLCVAASSTPKTVLTEKGAATLIRKIRKSGLECALAVNFITTHAPQEHQQDYLDLWSNFIEESLATLRSDMDYALQDALALLRHECHINT